MNIQGDTYERDESFSEAEHQLIGMKISYEAEEIANEIELLGEDEIERRMLLEYQEVLNDRSIRFVNDVPQYLITTSNPLPLNNPLDLHLYLGAMV
ncbi:hypothetical protein MM221_05620 [Salipaludibacillus sp. LMS25]|jgi:hypothetical protein|uniref:hypothetical protein n=1 Tax=Salipaludibacillus sp. LMS25 TaxID=2924031 RepID=UPI0020D1B406|nr:hypothetical protein [Salipaludibacillus sp. LMS25]UTR16039.1 hypothetical protein MM221_05620 [Salipaludibacillus sp. LMS25]